MMYLKVVQGQITPGHREIAFDYAFFDGSISDHLISKHFQ